MRRWLAIFLLVLLPTQATWAVVAGYCVDSPGVTAGHFGHHDRSLHGLLNPYNRIKALLQRYHEEQAAMGITMV